MGLYHGVIWTIAVLSICGGISFSFPTSTDEKEQIYPYREVRGAGTSGSGSGIFPGDGTYPVDCIKAYRLEAGKTFALPSHCPDVLPPAQLCTCPDPSTVEEAGTDVIIFDLNTHVSVRSRFVQVLVEAVIRNPTSNVQTADFETVLPGQAFISKFEIEADGEVFPGVVEEKEVARKKFTEAKKRGRTAGTVVQRGKSKFGTTVSVSAYCEMSFRLHYEYVAERFKGKFQIPISVTPNLPVITRRLNISIEDPSGVNCLEAENYKNAEFDYESKKVAKLNYKLNRTEVDDFVITYDLDQDSLSQHSGTTLYDSQGFVFVSYTLPESQCYHDAYNPACPARNSHSRRQDPVEPSFDSLPKCVSFVIDRSGSMSGSRIRQAKESLVLILNVLREFDYAAIISFESRIRVEHKLSLIRTNLTSLVRVTQRITALGLTDINGGLLKGVQVLKQAVSKEIECIHQLVFLTDGEPTAGVINLNAIERNYNAAVRQFETDTGGRTIHTYTLAYGENVNLQLLQGLVVENSGFSRSINLNKDVESQLTEFYREIACPLLCGMRLRYDNASIVNVTRNQFSACYFDGEQLVIGGQVANPEDDLSSGADVFKSISLSGEAAKGISEFDSQVIKVAGESTFVERVFAHLQIQRLLEEKRTATSEAKKELDSHILYLALKYQLVTPLTSMIVVKPCANMKPNTTNDTTTPTPTTPTTATTPTTMPPTSASTTSSPSTTSSISRIDFDPHFLATTATGHKLCYSVDGRDGEVYNILIDRGIVVNGKIISFRYKGVRKTYFGTISVKFKPPNNCSGEELLIVIDSLMGLAVLNSHKVIHWGEPITYTHRYGYILSARKRQLQFVLSFPKYNIELAVSHFVRNEAFVGLAVTGTSGLTMDAHGLIGQFLVMETSVTADDKKMHLRDQWYDVGPWQRLDPASGRYVPCYAVRPKGNVILEGEIPDYLMENMFDEDLKYGSYSKSCPE